MRALSILRPGLLTTVQDLGRPGLGALGIPPSGALDEEALRLANLLVGNPEGEAALEMAFSGPVLEALEDLHVAVAGGAFGPAPGRAVPLRKGSRIVLDRAGGSPWAVLAVSGGIVVPEVLGSRSTCLAAGFGGHEGRKLREGDRLPVGPSLGSVATRVLPPGRLEVPEIVELRVLPGPHEALFPEEALRRFYAGGYTLKAESNRTGFRLAGPLVLPSQGADAARLASHGTVTGTVQVPSDGEPIVLLADRPTTGGYPWLATVIRADVARLVRARPGQRIHFSSVTLSEARALHREREERISLLSRET